MQPCFDFIPRAPLTAAELIEHPEFQTVTWDLKPSAKGDVNVAVGRGGPIKIAYEVHGNGPIHLVVHCPLEFLVVPVCMSISVLVFCYRSAC